MTCNPYGDPRLVALYDQDNRDGPDHDFYRRLASDISARRIVDLGCGTGLLTASLADSDRTVIGVDPAPAMLGVAQRRQGADQVTWLPGDAENLPGNGADLALMTGNVAQVFIDDAEWAQTLACLRNALRRGGTLAFETRNPAARIWRGWTRTQTFRRNDTAFGPLTRWVQNARENVGVVTYDAHYVFESTDEHLVSHGRLRFRSDHEIADDLQRHGFALRHLYGDWRQGSLAPTSRVMVFVATAR